MISTKQIQLLQIARKQTAVDEGTWRLVLKNIGGVESSTKLSHRGMEAVMAYLESVGFVDQAHGPGYWKRQEQLGGDRETRFAKHLATQTPYNVEALAHRFSHGRTQAVEELNPMERYELIEMLKAVIHRNATARQSPPTTPATTQSLEQLGLFEDTNRTGSTFGLPDVRLSTRGVR